MELRETERPRRILESMGKCGWKSRGVLGFRDFAVAAALGAQLICPDLFA